MKTTEITRRYVDAWNGHDAAILRAMKNLILVLIAVVSLEIAANASLGRYVLQPGAPIATSVEDLRSGKVIINNDYKIVFSVPVKGLPPGILAFKEGPNGKTYYVDLKYAPEKDGR
jgi:hypothetical protein